MTNREVRLAQFGIGRWGKNLLNELVNISSVKYCVGRGDAENKIWLTNNHPTIEYSTDIDKVLSDQSIDAVVIATPIKTHYSIAKKSLSSGKHVFIEKTSSSNIHESRELAGLATDRKKKVFIGYVWSYHPIFEKVKKMHTQKHFHTLHISWNKFGSFSEDIFYNLLSHDIGLTQELIGKVTSASVIDAREAISECDNLLLKLSCEKGNAFVHINRISSHKTKIINFFSDTEMYSWEGNNLYKLDFNTKAIKQLFSTDEHALSIECQSFLKCITSHKKPRTDIKYCIDILKVIEKIKNG